MIIGRKGILCVVSGPSGSGKTTLCRRFADSSPDAVYSVSCTTRPPREGEVDGEDYHFLSREAFEEKVAAGDLLEYAQVHGSQYGRYYGTLKGPVLDHLREGRDVLMDLDIQGAAQLRAQEDPEIQEALVDIFILTRSLNDLKDRLLARGAMEPEELALRLKNADEEMSQAPGYHYNLITGDREADFQRFSSIMDAERQRAVRLVRAPETQESAPD